jgi:hypothetical protein
MLLDIGVCSKSSNARRNTTQEKHRFRTSHWHSIALSVTQDNPAIADQIDHSYSHGKPNWFAFFYPFDQKPT